MRGDRMSPYRLWGSIEDGAIEFESLTEDTLEGALDVIRKSFFINESVCKGVALTAELGASKELEELCLDAAKDGVSVVATDFTTGEVIGVAFNKIQVLRSASEKTAFEVFSENCKHKASKCLVDFMINVDSRINLFKHYNTDCIFEIMFLATLPDKQQRRIGETLVTTSIEVAKQLKRGKLVKTPVKINGNDDIHNLSLVPSIVSAIMTSNYSQKIARKCGFESLARVSYQEFHFDGKTFSERIGDEHPNCALVAKTL
ncbi:uncharacterized protein LOC143174255 [Nomia melanderi]|uniref:uncharacterized protein LOC143174255 n=1 Tax=Nomia melanderi TaxID=2448451 RepID=UPI003FCE3F53